MATGDLLDMVARLRAKLPAKWFNDSAQATQATQSPILDGLLNGPAFVWSWVYSLLQWVKSQTRIATASGVLLDMIALDYFANYLSRRPGEPDASLRNRINLELLRPKGTRAAVIKVVTDLTGNTPGVFEPTYTADTGGYGYQGMTVGSGMAYGASGGSPEGAGGWGSMALPFQFFITAQRAVGGGIPNVAGYYYGSGWAGGGYGVGAIEYGDAEMTAGQITDQEIYNAINNVRPAATIAWTALTG